VVPSLFESIQVMISNIPIYINNIYEYLKDLFKQSPELSLPLDQINQNITSSLTNVVVPSMDTIMTNLTAGISSFIGGLIDVIIGLIISVYLLYDKESFIKGTKNFFQAFMPEKVYDTVMTTLGFADKIFGGFMIAKIIDSILIGILSFIIFSIFQIPYALIISVIVGVTNVIPYFGPFIGAVPCAMLLLLISPKKAITFLILIFLIQQFDGNILGPKLIGNKTGIKSFWVLFSILVFGGLFGFAGMIFGVPVFAVIYSVISDAINKKLDKKKSK
jgi:predicted PurR-regulated permease PerM